MKFKLVYKNNWGEQSSVIIDASSTTAANRKGYSLFNRNYVTAICLEPHLLNEEEYVDFFEGDGL